MTARLLALVHSKVALAVLGVLLAGGSGAAVVAANHAQNPSTHSPSTSAASHTPGANNANSSDGNHAHTVALEGKLTAYVAGHTISIQTKDTSGPTVVGVDSNTRVDGVHASTLSDLAHAIGHDVQVQATKQSNGSLLAWKITVQGDTSNNGDSNHGSGNDNGNSDSGQQHTVAGTIATIGTGSFTVKTSDGTSVTVTVSGSTTFEGGVSGIGNLKSGARVTVQGSLQSNGDLAAARIEVQGND